MSRGLGRIQESVLASLYKAHHAGAGACDLTRLVEHYGLEDLIPGYDSLSTGQLRSPRATLRRTFRTLETRKLVECEKRTERHPNVVPWSSTTIDRLYLRITTAGINYVEDRGLQDRPRRSATVGRNQRRERSAPYPLDSEWARLAWNRAVSAPHRQTEWDELECQLIEAALDRGRTWQGLADERGYASGEALRQRYRRLRGGVKDHP